MPNDIFSPEWKEKQEFYKKNKRKKPKIEKVSESLSQPKPPPFHHFQYGDEQQRWVCERCNYVLGTASLMKPPQDMPRCPKNS